MKTLNERVYEYLLNANKPQTVSMTAAAFPEVPAMILGKTLLGIAAEGIAYYAVKDGKMYFSTDPSHGKNATPCHTNLNQLSMGTGLLSALLGEGTPDLGALLAARAKSFPEHSDNYPAFFNNTACSAERYSGQGYSIGFPEGFKVTKDPDDSHDYQAWYPVPGNEDSPLESCVLIYINFKPVEGNPSRETAFAQVCMAEQMFSKMGLSGEKIAYRNGNVDAFYMLSYPNTFGFIARPDGMMNFRIDWTLDDGMPPKALAEKLIANWLDSFTYTGSLQYYVPQKLSRPEMLKSELTEQDLETLTEEMNLGINEYNRLINAAKVRFTTEKATKAPTSTIYNARIALQEAAGKADGYMLDMMDFIAHYAKVMPKHSVVTGMYDNAITLFNIVSEICSEIKIDGGAIGAYNSATDLVISGRNNESTYTVQVYPPHFPEFLRFITLGRIENTQVSEEEKKTYETVYKNHLNSFEASQKEQKYQCEFKMEGGMLAAYLGDEAHVVIPDYVKSIGDFSFKGCHKLETVTMGDSVCAIGYAPFDDCPNLTCVTIPDSVEAINIELQGFPSSMHSKLKIRGYADSYAQQFAKSNKIPFEVIPEEHTDPIITLEDGSGDFLDGLWLPVPKGFISSERLSPAEKKAFTEAEDTSHLRYACVPSDTPEKFAGYKDAVLSVSSTDAPANAPNALEIAKDAESRLNGTQHVHDKFRTCTAENGKIVIKYDLVREGEEDGTKWSIYIALIFREDKMNPVQFFMNGNFTHRQQEHAVKTWASAIRFAKTVQAEEAKKQEADAENAYKAAVTRWENEVAEINRQRSEALNKALSEAEGKRREEIESKYSNDLKTVNAEKAICEQKRADAQKKLVSLGLFQFAEKKAAKKTIFEMAVKLQSLTERLASIELTYQKEKSSFDTWLSSTKQKLEAEITQEFPMPSKPRKPRPIKPFGSPSGSRVLTANELTKQAIVDGMIPGEMYTITDLTEVIPELYELSNQRISALLLQLTNDGYVERIVESRRTYFRLLD